MWWIGDWLNHWYPEGYVDRKVYNRLGEVTGMAKSQLKLARTICKSIKLMTRVINLSFKHHRVVASEPEERQRELLAWAVGPPRRTVRELMAHKKRTAITESDPDDLHIDGPVRWGDALKLMPQYSENSFHLIFTDPPYDRDHLKLYWETVSIAEKILVPYGNLVMYAPNYGLEEILKKCNGEMRYWWTIAMKHSGKTARQEGKGVLVEWKPLLWFVKTGRLEDKEYIRDFIVSQEPEKKVHAWEQSHVEAEYCIEHMTRPGDKVFDPFCGSGTTLFAAQKLGRKPFGIDIEREYVDYVNANLEQSNS